MSAILELMFYRDRFMSIIEDNVSYYRAHFILKYGKTGLENLGFMGTVYLTMLMLPVVGWVYTQNKTAAFLLGFAYDPRRAMAVTAVAWLYERHKFAAFVVGILGIFG
jgi:hypothetical protein